MGVAIETVAGFVTAPGSTFTALTMSTGDSLTIKNQDLSKKAQLLQAWAFNNVAGVLRIRSTKLHDNVQGIRWQVQAAGVFPQMTPGHPQRVYPQDPLIVELTGTSTASEIETACLMIYYEDLPGTAQRLTTPDDVQKRGVNIVDAEIAITTGAGGGWTGSKAINGTFDNWKANTDYAILGGQVDTRCAAASVKGPDSGNLRWAIPGELNIRHVTMDWFRRLSQVYNMALIPIWNSANKATTNVEVATDDEAPATNVSFQCVELAPK